MLDRGEMVEFDTGDVLLSNGKSHLSAMVAQTGAAEAGYLRSLAKVHQPYAIQSQGNGTLNEHQSMEPGEEDPLMPSFQPLYFD